MAKRFQIFLGIFFVVVFAVVGFIYWSKDKAEPAVKNQSPSPSQSDQPKSDPTATWKRYRNEEYGFTLQYPPEWNVLKLDTKRLQITYMQNTVTVSVLDFRSSTATFQDWINERPYALIDFKGGRALRWHVNGTEQVLIPSEDN